MPLFHLNSPRNLGLIKPKIAFRHAFPRRVVSTHSSAKTLSATAFLSEYLYYTLLVSAINGKFNYLQYNIYFVRCQQILNAFICIKFIKKLEFYYSATQVSPKR